MHLILPKTLPDLTAHRQAPMFFLAGPIMGGGDWHVAMSELLAQQFGNPIIVNPSRYKEPHRHASLRMSGNETHFVRQTDWERHYLEQAAEKWPSGCIIFWLAEQKEPRPDGQAYARDTRGEIGEWRGRMIYAPHLRVVIGAEKDFPGLSQIRRNFELCLPDFKICTSMEEVAQQASSFVGRS